MQYQPHSYSHLDAARGLSAFVVLIAHMVQIFWLRIIGLDSYAYHFSSIASHYAVVIFFILSGFLITHSIELNATRNKKFKVLDYLCARLARIYPPFLVAVIVTGCVYLILGAFSMPGRGTPMSFPGDLYSAREILHLNIKEIIHALMMLEGLLDVNGPLWSLYIEVKLYVLLACAYCLRGPFRFVVSASVGLMVLVAGLRYNPEFGRFASFWVIGCLAYYLVSTQIERRRLKISLSILILFLMVMDANLRLMLHNPSVPMSLSSRTLIELLVAIFIAYLLFYLRVNLIIGSRMAGYSYTLYVTHFPVLLLFQSLFIHNAEPGISPTVLFSFAACFVALVLARWAAVMESRKEAIQRYCTSSILLLRNKFLYVKKTT